METIPVAIPSTFDFSEAEDRIERALAAVGLRVALKTTLKQYPGSVHWHVKVSKQTGTLEITLWAARQHLWFSVHENRSAAWIPPMIKKINHHITNQL